MHVAWVSPYLPEPATSGGPIRQQSLARALARRATLHLFARTDPWEVLRARSPELAMFATRWVGRDYLPRQRPTASSRVRSGSPVSLWRAVAALHAKTPLSLVVVAHSWAAAGVETTGLPWLLDEHNVESRFFADSFAARGQQGPRVEQEIAAMRAWEQHLWANATALSCVSAADACLMAPHRSAGSPARQRPPSLLDPVVVENGVDLDALRPIPLDQRSGGVLFVGSLHHRPNVDAALRLCRGIMPSVWRRHPEVPLTIVGGPVPNELRAAAERAGTSGPAPITLTGRVADPAPWLEAARVQANPITHGAGTSLKTVQALASGAPLVSTEVGARGFALRPDEHYLLAESDDEHAAAIARLIEDPALASRLATTARSWAAHYAWPAVGERFAELACAAASAP